MGALETAEKNILKKKLEAEQIADMNLNKVLKDENVKILFVKCKKLVVEIASLEVDGLPSGEKRKEYNDTRELLAQLLVSMGVDKSELRPKYECARCKDTGYVSGTPCECLKRELSRELIRRSGIDASLFPKFSNDYSMFENAKEIKCIYEKMKKFVSSADTVVDLVLITGDTGVGKTHLLGCMTTHAIELAKTVKYTTAFNFNQDMLKYHCAKLEEKEDILDPYVNSEFLFIDDLGSENKIKNVTDEYLYLIINERMLNHKKTVINTNLDFGQIQDVYGERIFSRLMHKKQSLKIKFNGIDQRVGIK
ncbi:MAG: hypothetical protein E7354_05425 [Clostridiales bacterium]|nr:hypothetical protein [Clostridiales bacterium]